MKVDDPNHASVPHRASAGLRVAVVGAGISGLGCARTLADHGYRVRVFDKARGAGGRMSTRRAGAWRFDHGAQYFTVRDPGFRARVAAWRRDGLVAPWTGRIAVLDGGMTVMQADDTERLVAVPGMNALCRHLARDLGISYETRVASLERTADRWRLGSSDGRDLGDFDAVVVSAPAPQAADLLLGAAPQLAARAGAVAMSPCWAVMAAFAEPLAFGFDGAFVHRSPLAWVARNASKPGRPEGEAWVLHGSPGWSQDNLEVEPAEAAARLLEAFDEAAGGLGSTPAHLEAHRWRYALPQAPLAQPCLVDAGRLLAVCGDWCGGPRVEGAFLSGSAAAQRLLEIAAG
ncbi:MAG TPA: FAD-dependent oxidoreductase [Candidatus Sulfomarinibacteraceae bacterium]|nr:FAD-dependent oxidoreductase [Candidatus Sulfomarinibacteraceae bacterium]